MSRNLLKSLINPGLVSLVAAGWSLAAGAHVSVANGPLFSGKTHEIVLSMPHGCSQVVDGVSRSFDTARVEVTVPAQITGVRPVDAVFGSAIAEKNAQGQVVKLVWKKADAAIVTGDTQHYTFSLRGKIAAEAFEKVYLPTTQYCKNAAGEEISVSWNQTESGDHSHDAAATPAANPAPSFVAYPARFKGWNQYTAKSHLHDLSIFSDAEIVWKGQAAYSANPAVLNLIKADSTATVLDAIHPDDVFWVKY